MEGTLNFTNVLNITHLTNDPLELLHNGLVDAGLFADHGVVFVVGVVGVPKFAIGTKFKFEKLVTEFALVSDVVAQVEITLHLDRWLKSYL